VVRVADGIYSAGGAKSDSMSNRVVLAKAITVESINGPAQTWLVGAGPNGSSAVRCAYVATGAVLAGFTLTNGHSRTVGNYVYELSGGAFLDYAGILNHCTLRGNSAGLAGGGAYCEFGGKLNNCIVWSNAPSNWYVSSGEWTNCCTLPAFGVNSITAAPQFMAAGNHHLQAGSACIDAGVFVPGLMGDREGTPRPLDGNVDGAALPDIGAYEFASAVADTDGDQASDFSEYVADTAGTDGADWFHISAISNQAFFFESSANRQYTLLYRTNLVEGGWINVASQTDVMGNGVVIYLSGPSDFPACFYTVQVEVP